MKDKIWLSSPHMSDEGYELKYVHEAFETNWLSPLGPNVEMFEKEFAEKITGESPSKSDRPETVGPGTSGRKAAGKEIYCTALSSGTGALHLALLAEGVGEGDIVLCPSLTFSATANAIIYLKAKPVFIDSDEESWNIDPLALEEALKKYSKAKAVIVVHLYGVSADMDPIMNLCQKYKVPIIEDAAESLGCRYKGQQTGTFGASGIFSFNGNKIITTSGGGMYVSHDPEKAEKVRFWATQSRDKARHYEHSELGFNYRMSNVLAGIGRGQLMVLDQRIAKKRYIHDYYKKALVDLPGIAFMPEKDFSYSTYWLTCITSLGQTVNMLPPDNSAGHSGNYSDLVNKLMEALNKENIEARPIWKPMHLQPYFQEFDFVSNTSFSEDLFKRGLCLPSDTKMTDKDLDRVCGIIRNNWE